MARFCSIIAAVWSKSSFAITLLPISDGWTRRTVWFILISVNIVFGVNATIQLVQCWPPEKIWHQTIPGTCWISPGFVRGYNTFVAGEFLGQCGDSGPTLTLLCSLRGYNRYHASTSSMEDHLAGQDTIQREVCGFICYEYGYLVSLARLSNSPSNLAVRLMRCISAGIASFLKITSLSAIGNVDLSEFMQSSIAIFTLLMSLVQWPL